MCGIGGRTIAEAQQTLSYEEFLSWLRYRRKRGSLHVGMRIEYGSAQLAVLYANKHSKEGGLKLHHFAPHLDEPPVTLQEAMNSWK